MEPRSKPKQGKLWGETVMPFAFNSTEVWVLRIEEGGYCSNHSHQSKWNRFYVVTGELIVTEYSDDGKTERDKTRIGPGEMTDVPPGVRHTFEAMAETVAMEFYWVPLDPEDIERHGTEGGRQSYA